MSAARRVAATLATLLLVLSLVPPPAAAQDEGVRLEFVRAEMLFRSGDAEGARALLDRVIDALEESGVESEEQELLLTRALVYRVRLAWDAADRDAADADLDRLLALDPEIDLSSRGVPTELAERLEARRERRVGYLQIALFPQDARVSIDGEPVADPSSIVALPAGDHVVVASRHGYASATQEVDIRANRTEGIGFELQRTSATLSIQTHPAAASVFLDGRPVGETRPGGAEGTSLPLRIVGLLPGSHELEVTLADHRPFRQRVEVPDLADYDLGTLMLERALGVLVLRGLEPEANVTIDGAPVELEFRPGVGGGAPGTGSARLSLPVGAHAVAVTAPSGVFETAIDLGDGDLVTVDVDTRPGLAWLGIVGGEELDRQAVRDAVDAFDTRLSSWSLLDRAEGLPGLGRLPAGAEDGAGWTRWQQAAARAEPGAALFALATLPEDGRNDHFWLWLQAAPPGPSVPWGVRVDLGDRTALEALSETMADALPGPRPWLGATLIDTELAEGVRVVEVEASGPAGQAGLRPGDLVTAIDRQPVSRASEVASRIVGAEPFQALAFEVLRGGDPLSVPLRLGSSPQLPDSLDVAPPTLVWAAATAALADPASARPSWLLELYRGLALLRSGDAATAADRLGSIQVPGDPPFGQAAVDYWLGIAYLARPDPAVDDARAAFHRAVGRTGARLGHNDGPYVAPRARARLARLEAGDGEG